jgi:hypothetical protein
MPSQMKEIVTSYISSGNSNPLSINSIEAKAVLIIFPSKHISQLQHISGFLATHSLHFVACFSFVFLLISNISVTLEMTGAVHGRGSGTSSPGTSKR